MNKYHNTKITVDGHTFDSKKEARRYRELKYLESLRMITDLRLQEPFELIPAQKKADGKTERSVTYKADFTYYDSEGNFVVEDVKGVRTAEYKIKRKLMLQVHGITIKEV